MSGNRFNFLLKQASDAKIRGRSLPTEQNKTVAQLDAKINGLVHKQVDSRREAGTKAANGITWK